jgi:hypothetical protein
LLEGVSASWWNAVQEQIRRSEYQITFRDDTYLSKSENAYQAPNRAHNIRTYFTPLGIRVVPRTDVISGWELGLRLTGYGYAGDIQTLAVAQLTPALNKIEYHRGDLTEWYVNEESGLKQGFTILVPPASTRSVGGSNENNHLVLELAFSGDLIPVLVDSGQTIEFTTSSGVSVLRYSDLRVTDAGDCELPAYLSLSPSGVSILMDVSAATYPVTVDPLITSPSWTAESNQVETWFGFSLGTAGDVNRDGYDDVIVGAPFYDGGDIDEGAAFVYHGSATGLSTTPDWTAESNQAEAYFGISVGTAGDVNWDSYDDVIVGAPFYDGGQTDEGGIFVYHGSATGLSTTPDWTAESNQAGAYFGQSVGAAGDFNSDSYDDVIVGAIGYSSGPYIGAAFVYYGGSGFNGPGTTPPLILEDLQGEYRFGISVGTAGDINVDGVDDVIIGAEGAAFVYHGGSGFNGPSTTPALTLEGPQGEYQFGISVGTAGDVNGDGYDDVIIGAEEAAFVYYGGYWPLGLSTTPDWTVAGPQSEYPIRISVGTAGDVNGDGYDDVIVGAEGYDGGDIDEGAAFVYHGSATGLSTTPDWTAESNQAEAYFGHSVGTAGDVNGDGYDDVIVGAYRYDGGQTDEGRVFVYLAAIPPLANNDTYSTGEDTPLYVAAPGVLGNDSDPNGDPLTIGTPRPVSSASHGTLTLNADGSFTYTPNADYSGPDSFTYKANNGTANSNVATVTINIGQPLIEWVASFDDGLSDYAEGIALDDDGYVYVAGSSNSGSDDYSGANRNIHLIKYDSSGNVIWTQTYDGGLNDGAQDVALDGAGNVYVTGYSNQGADNSVGANRDFITIKYDSSGNVIPPWPQTYDSGDSQDMAHAIAVDASGNVYVTGSAFDTELRDYHTIKYDSSGNEIWSHTYDDGGRNVPYGVAVDASGGVYVTGSPSDVPGGNNTIKLDVSGGLEWERSYNGGGALAVDATGNVYTTGGSLSGTNIVYITTKYDPLGNEIWAQTYDSGYVASGRDLVLDAREDVYVTGTDFDYKTFKYGSLGNEIWNLTYDGGISDHGNGIAVDASGAVYVTGISYLDGKFDWYTIKYSYLPYTLNTQVGTDEEVGFLDEGVDVTFDDVRGAGDTSVTVAAGGTNPPSGFNLLGNYYDITTTARYIGNITVCINYNEADVVDESNLKLFHYENGSWVDVTTSLDTTANIICGTVTNLSEFIVAEPTTTLTYTGDTLVAANTPTTLAATLVGEDSQPISGAVVSFHVNSQSSSNVTDANGVASCEVTIGTPGIYEVNAVFACDPLYHCSSTTALLTVYDPEGGFVTGGGWIDSSERAYAADPMLTGHANFGFVSKYKKGSEVPTGQTEFQFNVATLNFHSSSYDWLVVTGSNYARFKGSGTINGMGDYRFMIWAGDDDQDTFRIRIWEEDESSGEETVIYDNDADQPIAGGRIVIHDK